MERHEQLEFWILHDPHVDAVMGRGRFFGLHEIILMIYRCRYDGFLHRMERQPVAPREQADRWPSSSYVRTSEGSRRYLELLQKALSSGLV